MNPYSPNKNQDEEPNTPINYDVEIVIGMSFVAGIFFRYLFSNIFEFITI